MHHMLEAAHPYMQMMELGQVGHADDAEGLSAFYVHSQQGASFGDAGPLTQALLRAGDSKVCPCLAATCCKASHSNARPAYACTLPLIVRHNVSVIHAGRGQ